MPKKFIKRFMPNPQKLKRHRSLQFLGELLHNPYLWHLNRHSVANACFVGIFVAFLPIPFQMVLAAFLAVSFHTNLPVSVGLVWLTNPVTITPIFYFCYKVGLFFTGEVSAVAESALTWQWLVDQFQNIWQPLILGSLTVGLITSSFAYFIVHRLWCWHVMQSWRARKFKRKKAA